MEQSEIRKLALLAGAIVLGIILIVLLLSILSRQISAAGAETPPGEPAPPAVFGQQASSAPEGESLFLGPTEAARSIDYRLIAVPNEFENLFSPTYQPSRERKLQWDFPDIERFWTDPMDIATEALGKENEQKIRQLLGTVD